MLAISPSQGAFDAAIAHYASLGYDVTHLDRQAPASPARKRKCLKPEDLDTLQRRCGKRARGFIGPQLPPKKRKSRSKLKPKDVPELGTESSGEAINKELDRLLGTRKQRTPAPQKFSLTPKPGQTLNINEAIATETSRIEQIKDPDEKLAAAKHFRDELIKNEPRWGRKFGTSRRKAREAIGRILKEVDRKKRPKDSIDRRNRTQALTRERGEIAAFTTRSGKRLVASIDSKNSVVAIRFREDSLIVIPSVEAIDNAIAKYESMGFHVDAQSLKERKRRKVKKVMGEFEEGELHSGSKEGPVVKSRKQAVAIALSESRNLDGVRMDFAVAPTQDVVVTRGDGMIKVQFAQPPSEQIAKELEELRMKIYGMPSDEPITLAPYPPIRPQDEYKPPPPINWYISLNPTWCTDRTAEQVARELETRFGMKVLRKVAYSVMRDKKYADKVVKQFATTQQLKEMQPGKS